MAYRRFQPDVLKILSHGKEHKQCKSLLNADFDCKQHLFTIHPALDPWIISVANAASRRSDSSLSCMKIQLALYTNRDL